MLFWFSQPQILSSHPMVETIRVGDLNILRLLTNYRKNRQQMIKSANTCAIVCNTSNFIMEHNLITIN